MQPPQLTHGTIDHSLLTCSTQQPSESTQVPTQGRKQTPCCTPGRLLCPRACLAAALWPSLAPEHTYTAQHSGSRPQGCARPAVLAHTAQCSSSTAHSCPRRKGCLRTCSTTYPACSTAAGHLPRPLCKITGRVGWPSLGRTHTTHLDFTYAQEIAEYGWKHTHTHEGMSTHTDAHTQFHTRHVHT